MPLSVLCFQGSPCLFVPHASVPLQSSSELVLVLVSELSKVQDLGFRKVTWSSWGSAEVGASYREAMGALKAPMTGGLFDDSGLCSALGT